MPYHYYIIYVLIPYKPRFGFSRRPGILNIYYSAACYVTFFLKKYPFQSGSRSLRLRSVTFRGSVGSSTITDIVLTPTRITNTPLTHARAVAERSRTCLSRRSQPTGRQIALQLKPRPRPNAQPVPLPRALGVAFILAVFFIRIGGSRAVKQFGARIHAWS